MVPWNVVLRQITGALRNLPPELSSIIIAYATEIPHTWRPFQDDYRMAVTVGFGGRTISSNPCKLWHFRGYSRMVSTQSVIDGPQRWMLRIQFFTDCDSAYIAAGATMSTDGSRPLSMHYDAVDPDDLLFELTDGPLETGERRDVRIRIGSGTPLFGRIRTGRRYLSIPVGRRSAVDGYEKELATGRRRFWKGCRDVSGL